MINQVEKKNPKRRFKEFLGKENWNVHTLGTVLMSMYNGQTPSRSKGEYWNGKINWLTSGELNCGIVNDTFEKITELGLDSANLKIIPKGILVIAITGLEASGTRGNCAILGCNTTLNQSCMALFPIRSLISSDFLFNWYLFIGDYYGIKYTQGTKQQSYNSKILNDLEIVIPSLDEQNKISGFFSKLDSMIDFQKRKLNKLQATKKALLQEMFPEKGQDKPKRRFKGFIDAWEQRKFKDIAFKRGKISEADLPYIEFEDINSGIGTLNKNILQKVGHKKGILFEAGDVLFGKLRPYLQNWLLCQFMGIAVGDFWVFQPQIVSSAFLYYLIQSEAYQSVANISSGTKMPRSSWSLVSESRFSIPKYKEATMIGEFFTSIDKNITLHQRKLDKLNNLNQAYLNEMFV